MTLYKEPFENIVGKGENAGNQHYLLFPQCFLPFPKHISIFYLTLGCRLQMLSIWTGLKFCGFVKSSFSQTIAHALVIPEILSCLISVQCFNTFRAKAWEEVDRTFNQSYTQV